MTATVTDLLAVRERRHQPALYFDTDLDALAYAAGAVDELRHLADSALLLDAEQVRLPLDQLHAIIRACMRVHTSRKETR